MPMSDRELDELATGIVGVMKEALAVRDARIIALEGQLTAVEQRLAAIEARPDIRYCGRWFPDSHYSEGSLVTRGGGLWIAERRTMAQPGSDDSGWRLIVKSGQVPTT